MKRSGNLFERIVSVNNIMLAHQNAKKGKRHYREVKCFELRPYHNARKIRNMLIANTYVPSPYIPMTIKDRGKEREILKTRYFPDRIVHHALMQVVQPILESVFIKDTYQSIVGRGTHKALSRIQSWMGDEKGTRYCLKIDIKKFYPNVDNSILKDMFRRKIKCEKTLLILDGIVDSTKGLPIGNYTSQTLANYYLAYFDHFVKEELETKYYARYADDIVIFGETKEELHVKFKAMQTYLRSLKLEIKGNWQVFEVRTRGLDFLGYRLFGYYTLLRKAMVTKIKRAMLKPIDDLSGICRVMSYLGWIRFANTYNFLRTIITTALKHNMRLISKAIKIKNPLRGFYMVQKIIRNRIQLRLF